MFLADEIGKPARPAELAARMGRFHRPVGRTIQRLMLLQPNAANVGVTLADGGEAPGLDLLHAIPLNEKPDGRPHEQAPFVQIGAARNDGRAVENSGLLPRKAVREEAQLDIWL